MPKYMCLMRSAPGGHGKQEAPSPAQMQEMYASFNAWREKFKDQIVDLGGKLKGGGKILTTSGVTDGPFVEMKEVIGGYMVISADSYEGAIAVARESPGYMPGASLEIREIA
jgi:hypothetical protein